MCGPVVEACIESVDWEATDEICDYLPTALNVSECVLLAVLLLL